MTKTSGLGDNCYIGGYDLSGDIMSLSKISGSTATLDVTGISKSAHERLGGLRGGEIDFTTAYNTAVGQEHVALSALPTSAVSVMYLRGTTQGNPALYMQSYQVNYDPTRGTDGMFTFNVQCLSNDAYGLLWGKQLTAGKRTDTSATNGPSYDNTAGNVFGAEVVLQVFSFTGTDITIKMQHSTDNSTWSDFLPTLGPITSAPAALHGSSANNASVNRYLRVATTTSGGFTSCTFAFMVSVNPIANMTF